MKTKKNSKKKILTFSLPLQNFKVKHGCTTRFKREIKERDIRREERARSSSSSSLSSFTLSLSLSLSLSSRGKRERKRENCCTFFFQFSLSKKKGNMREHKRAHQSELLVIVRDARGVREEKPLRVRAKFDDEEKMTVRFALIFLFLRVFLFCIFFFVFARGSLVLMLTRKRTRVSDQHCFPPSLSFCRCVCSIERENRKRRDHRRTRNGTRRWFSGERRRR